MSATISNNSRALLAKRYLEGESVDSCWDRVSGGSPTFRNLLSELRFLPNSPTIFNAGRNNGCTLSACFTADTIIHTLAGDFTVAELLARGEEEFDVFSTDGKRLKVGKAFGLKKTRTAANVYRVTFDSGDAIKLTADHLVMMRDGTYREVEDLQPGDSIMPFNNDRKGGYRIIWQTIDGHPIAAYKWSFLQANGRWAKKDWHIHHCNFNKGDDRPANLLEITEADHAALHAAIMNPMHRPGAAAKISAHMKGNKRGVGPKPGVSSAMKGNRHAAGTVWTQERKEKQRQRMLGKKLNAGRKFTSEQRAKMSESRKNPSQETRDKVAAGLKKYYASHDGPNKGKKFSEASKAKMSVGLKKCYAEGRRPATFNHKVVSIEYAGKEDVYDLSVHKYHNFAANGVFIHNCFVFDVADSMFGKGSITETRDKAIAVAKAGGGVGYYFGALRPKGAPIKSVHRVACGPVTVLRDYHGISKLITQGGKRELAQMGVLPCDHPDIADFVHCKDADPQGLCSFNISVSWDKQSVVAAATQGTKQNALWHDQCKSAWGHGCPGMFFPDTVNASNPNPHLGLMQAPNPCGETPNRSDEPCNLGSLVAGRYFSPGNRDVDWKLLEEDSWNATLFLDDILDRNEFPHPDITEAALLTRKLGLGVMGWADLLAMMHVHYDTEQALVLAKRFMGLIESVSHAASAHLAKEKGPYKGYSDQTNGPLRRNETNTSIAPTGSIGIIADVKGFSIEPWFAVENTRTTNEGMVMIEGVPDWIARHLDGFRPKTAHEIAPVWHVRMQAAFQEHTDLGVSKTVNLPESATVQDVSDIYSLMYSLGCKGGTVFRNNCRPEAVLVSTEKGHSVYSLPASSHRKMPRERKAEVVKFKVAGTEVFLTVGHMENGDVGEIFVNGNFGSTMAGLLNALCITFSVALQSGASLARLCSNHCYTRFEPSGLTDNPDVPTCTSLPDLIVNWLRVKYLKEELPKQGDSGLFCPDCGASAIYSGGCLSCPSAKCGWTRCG